jgi:hypothetical protein
LHVLEAKTGGFSPKKARAHAEQSIQQIEVLKRHLQGQFGRYIAVNPRETAKGLKAAWGDFVSRAENAGIELALGKNAISDATRMIAATV